MGGVPVKHRTHGKVRRVRSHHALKKVQVSACAKCGGAVLSHRACMQCGQLGKSQRVQSRA